MNLPTTKTIQLIPAAGHVLLTFKDKSTLTLALVAYALVERTFDDEQENDIEPVIVEDEFGPVTITDYFSGLGERPTWSIVPPS